MSSSLIQRDLRHIWHPCSYMDDFTRFPPLIVEHAQGSYLHTNQGVIIDGISSWWCKSLGHGHPAVIGAIEAQLKRFEHVISANTTHPKIVALAEQLSAISGKQHVFFASDGSSAVEIALKLALQGAQLKGHTLRNEILALSNGYHGETLATLSVSDLGLYKAPFAQFNLPCHFVTDIPYVADSNDPLWSDCTPIWPKVESQLDAIKDRLCALIFEPIVQGAGGMRCYSAHFLTQLVQWAQHNQILVIADEIMTGLGRTGTWLGCEHAAVSPDLICLSKGLTSGTLPLSAVLIDHSVYELFSQIYQEGQAFLHSHTYSGHPLGICAALATLQTMQSEGINQQAQALGAHMLSCFTQVAEESGKLTNIRSIGGIVAGDLVAHPNQPRLGYYLAQAALRHGALLRPLGNTLYWLPPLNTKHATIEHLAEITLAAIRELY